MPGWELLELLWVILFGIIGQLWLRSSERLRSVQIVEVGACPRPPGWQNIAIFVISSRVSSFRLAPMMMTWGNRLRSHPVVSNFNILSVELPEGEEGDYPSLSMDPRYKAFDEFLEPKKALFDSTDLVNI